jgi:hypothetical protein
MNIKNKIFGLRFQEQNTYLLAFFFTSNISYDTGFYILFKENAT